jgi:hypothetical protein
MVFDNVGRFIPSILVTLIGGKTRGFKTDSTESRIRHSTVDRRPTRDATKNEVPDPRRHLRRRGHPRVAVVQVFQPLLP